MTPVRISLALLHPDDLQWLSNQLELPLQTIGVVAVVFRSDDAVLKLLRARRVSRKEALTIQPEPMTEPSYGTNNESMELSLQ